MHNNHGDTLVAALHLGDHLWTHGNDCGVVIALELAGPAFDRRGGPYVNVITLGGEGRCAGRTIHPFLAADHVHIGESYATAHSVPA